MNEEQFKFWSAPSSNYCYLCRSTENLETYDRYIPTSKSGGQLFSDIVLWGNYQRFSLTICDSCIERTRQKDKIRYFGLFILNTLFVLPLLLFAEVTVFIWLLLAISAILYLVSIVNLFRYKTDEEIVTMIFSRSHYNKLGGDPKLEMPN